MSEDEPRFYIHDVHDGNIADLQREVNDLNAHRGRFVGVVDEEDGGIIAYAIGEGNAARIVDGLSNAALLDRLEEFLTYEQYVTPVMDTETGVGADHEEMYHALARQIAEAWHMLRVRHGDHPGVAGPDQPSAREREFHRSQPPYDEGDN